MQMMSLSNYVLGCYGVYCPVYKTAHKIFYIYTSSKGNIKRNVELFFCLDSMMTNCLTTMSSSDFCQAATSTKISNLLICFSSFHLSYLTKKKKKLKTIVYWIALSN